MELSTEYHKFTSALRTTTTIHTEWLAKDLAAREAGVGKEVLLSVFGLGEFLVIFVHGGQLLGSTYCHA